MQSFLIALLVPILLPLFAKKRSIAGVTGLIVFLIFSSFGIYNYYQYKKLSQSPLNQWTVSEAFYKTTEEAQKVELVDAKVDCNRLINNSNYTAVYITDPSEELLIVGDYSRTFNCQNILNNPISGTIKKLSPARYNNLKSNDFDFNGRQDNSNILHLCAYCGTKNSLTGIILSIILALGGLALYPLSFYLKKPQSPKNKK